MLLKLRDDGNPAFAKNDLEIFFHLMDKSYKGVNGAELTKNNIDPINLLESFAI